MAQNLEFTEQRTLATRAAQNTLASTWTWEEKTPAEWDADLAAFTAQRETAQDAEADMLGQRGNLDAALDELHSLTRRSLSMNLCSEGRVTRAPLLGEQVGVV